jgi:hypothetical protein
MSMYNLVDKKIVLLFCLLTTLNAEASDDNVYDNVYGNWYVTSYQGEVFWIYPVDISSGGFFVDVSPSFMLSFGDKRKCYMSYGLTIPKDSALQGNRDKSINDGYTKSLLAKTEFIADNEAFSQTEDEIQESDFGIFYHARTLIGADTTTAFMFANTGRLRVEGSGIIMSFEMRGFREAVNKLINKYCED